jgi:hypothetical protein
VFHRTWAAHLSKGTLKLARGEGFRPARARLDTTKT